MTILVAGGAGFIGTNLIARLLESGQHVTAIDNFSRGGRANLASLLQSDRLELIEADLSHPECFKALDAVHRLSQVTEVWHLAANSDIPAGVKDAQVDLRDTFLTTFEILRWMQANDVRRLCFASSSAIYGDLGDREIREDDGPLLPISNYGAMKLASEAQISAAAEAFLDQVLMFRFPNVVGVPATHGVLLDFVRKLKSDPSSLDVLGNGTQQKAYLHVSDLIDAMLSVAARSEDKRTVVNVGPTDAGVLVSWIAEQVVARVSPSAAIRFGEGGRGWLGDVPKFRYSVDKVRQMGWSPKLGSVEAIRRAIDEIAQQEGF